MLIESVLSHFQEKMPKPAGGSTNTRSALALNNTSNQNLDTNKVKKWFMMKQRGTRHSNNSETR